MVSYFLWSKIQPVQKQKLGQDVFTFLDGKRTFQQTYPAHRTFKPLNSGCMVSPWGSFPCTTKNPEDNFQLSVICVTQKISKLTNGPITFQGKQSSSASSAGKYRRGSRYILDRQLGLFGKVAQFL